MADGREARYEPGKVYSLSFVLRSDSKFRREIRAARKQADNSTLPPNFVPAGPPIAI